MSDSLSEVLQKLDPDEPFFVLRAKDRLAPLAIRNWCAEANVAGVNGDKVDGALKIAAAMEEWGEENGTKLPD